MSRLICLECDEDRDDMTYCPECGQMTDEAEECPDCGALNVGDVGECHACGYDGE